MSLNMFSNMQPFIKENGEPITGKDGKVALFDPFTFADLAHGKFKPCEVGKIIDLSQGTRSVMLSDIDPRIWQRWDEELNKLRHSNYDNVYQSFVRNGLINRPDNVDKNTLRISFNVLKTLTNRVDDGHYAMHGDRMVDEKSPMTLIGARGDYFAHFIYEYGTQPWILDQLTSQFTELGMEMMISTMRERELAIMNGYKDSFEGLKPSTAVVPNTHGTVLLDQTAAELGSFTAGTWANGSDLAAINKKVNAAIRYMRRSTDATEPGQDLKGARFILLLGEDLYQWMGETIDTTELKDQTVMNRLMSIPQIIEVVEAVELGANEYMLVNADRRFNSFVDVVPMTTSQYQGGLAGMDKCMIIYLLMSMKVIATAEFKKNNLLVDESA